MQKIFLAVSLSLGLMVNAQSTEEASSSSNSERKNDIMLDPISLISVSAININYERLLNENSGVGLHAFAYLGDGYDDEDDDVFSQFSPYYRMYFGKKYASGFFVEGFVPITSTRYTEYYSRQNSEGYYYESSEEKKSTNIGIGVGFGGKWLTKKNIIFELSGGVARSFGKNDFQLTGKYMFGIGYRF